ncbi:laminin subunit alpha-1 isoform X1 [Eurosta solidaginis]|uniref:laminin subunit alpha-1 isoform X1 n=1 Tax=Eurosta solidaginis TaxID=178769 RepID=UPI003530AC59
MSQTRPTAMPTFTKMTSINKQKTCNRTKIKTFHAPLVWSCFTLLCSASFMFLLQCTPAHAATKTHKQLLQQQWRNLSPAQLLKEYTEIPLPANTSRADLIKSVANIESWTAHSRNGTKKLQRLAQQQQRQQQRAQKRKKQQKHRGEHKSHKQHDKLRKQREREQQEEQEHVQQQTQTHRKTKSGRHIESNINSNEFVADNIEFANAINAAAAAAGAAAETTSTTSQFAVNTNKRATSMQQRKKNGRNGKSNGAAAGNNNGGNHNGHGIRDVGGNQREKLHRNVLRMLNSQSESISGGGLFPPLFNVAPRAHITVNATCGQSGREEYCKLVDAYPHKQWATQCGICNAQSSDAAKQRPIEAVISNTNFDEQWWQSPTLQYGRHFEYVTITLDLQQVYQVFFVMLKSANSPRPASWILEKSLDGVTYEPWQYFGLSDADCQRRYGLAGQNGKYVFQNDTEVICTTQFSKALPLENGELHVSLLKNRPGAMDQTEELMNFITARYIRIRLQGMHTTANLDNSVDWLLDAQSLEKRSFYSLKQIRVSARLDCHGHADKTVELAEKRADELEYAQLVSTLQCVCQHNSCGVDCGECCALYQDKPFRNGTTRESNDCELCQCNGHAESCIYDAFMERGICQECQNNTAGNECEFCGSGYYRALDDAPSAPCQLCACTGRGAAGTCDAVGGQCHCREGFRGDRCDECVSGYYGDECRRCECDVRGTMPDTECAGVCKCKAHVSGDTCSECLPGYYDLSVEQPDGCAPCWCSGVGISCGSAVLQTLAFETLNDWKVTDMTRSQIVLPTVDMNTNYLVYGMYDLNGIEAIYWLAPQGYLGNRLTSYGARLSIQVSWVTIRGDTSGKPTAGPDVILFGRNGLKIAHGDTTYAQGSTAIINITIDETGWYHVPPAVRDIKTRLRRNEYHGSAVTRSQLLSVLSALDALLVRGTYHTDQVETSLERVIIYSGGTELGAQASSRVEQCVCPTGYTGLSCESCDFGFIRIWENSTEHQLVPKCIPCPCNGHSNSCDLQSGGCGNCMHNTYGERCERCKVGYYGNPLQGTEHDCKRCACPLLADSNNFSPSCQLKTYSIMDLNPLYGVVENSEYICTQCPTGYTGDHCEMCDDGYFGNPTELGSQCEPCNCDGGPCDVFDGQCIICDGNTEGWRCERCKLGYWGDPSSGCEPCDCYIDGSDSDFCDSTNGQCLCKPRFAGQKCDECDAGYANVDLKCLPCNCNPLGAEDVDFCDPDSGQCQCKSGVTGLKCDECSEGHFGLKEESNGCEECQCSPIGAITGSCDKRTGQCACLTNVTGRRCDKCKSGHWNLTQGVGCHDCRCDPAGSRNHECNPWTGQCDCKIGVGGQHCNECTDGFYGFSTDGCQRCTQCAGEGQVCDPLNGRCICPPNSRGLGCAQCVSGTWGWQPRLGCRNCACDHIGSIGQLCESQNGQCQCREGYAGRQCETCAIGYFGYPECRRCNCNADGSFVHATDGAITCDANGQCPCKTLVVGLKCDTCMKSTFGLSALNPEGCTRCFCFGRSSECEQSEWSWGHIRMAEARNLSVQYLRPQYVTNTEYEYIVVVQMAGAKSYREDAEIHLLNDLNLIPRSTGNVSIGAYTNFYHPLYFQLPPQFYGDRTSSYGGYLYFTLLIEGASRPLERKVLSRFPLVQIHSHKKLVLDYYEYENYEYALNVTYKVPLHESEWKYHHNSQSVDRANLMAALQNVKHIFVRASAFADFTEVVLYNVHMDSAIYVFGSTNMIAKGVEQCKCSKRYDGLSCQDPGKGYYRYRNVTEIETVFIEDLIGRVVPCHCNGRSNDCERETGVCLNCRDNTGGGHCEQCAEGFYGDPNSAHGCQSCPCPETSRNFAKGCNVWQGEVNCICKPGYTGKLCDRCRPGYFGNPLAYPNSTCQPCDCNLDGSATDDCDSQTGQCQCRAGVTGLKCDRCIAERHHLEEHGCRLCDNCTLLLLDYVELIGNKLRRGLHNMDLTGIPAPYLKVDDYERAYNTLQVHYEDYTNARKLLGSYDANELLKLDSHAENNKFQSRKALATAGKRQESTGELRNDVTALYVDIGALRSDILEYIYTLNNYGKSEQHMSLPMALDQARFYLDSIRQHQESVNNIRNSTQCAWNFYYHFGNASDAAFDQKARVEMFWRDLNQSNFRISDMRLHSDRTVEMQNEIDDTLEHIVNLRNHVTEDYQKIAQEGADVMDYLNQSLIPRTDVLIEENWTQQEQLSGATETIDRLFEQLNTSLGEGEAMQREVRKHWLPKAEKHAERLMKRSNEYARQFQPTRNGAKIALLASSAHKNISDAIEAARQASLEANERVLDAQRRLYPDDGSSVIERAQVSLNKSKQLQKEALAEMEYTEALKQKLKIHEDKVDGIKTTIYDAGTRTNNVSAHLHAAGNNSARKLAVESIEMSKNISEEMRHELHKARRLHEEILKLRAKFAILEPDWEIKLGRAEENISLTKTNIRLANISLSYVEEQSQKEKAKFDEWNNTMASQVQEIRDKIAKARHAAEGIKISLESLNPKCIRTYLPTSYGLSTSNTIKISFALPNRNGNSPLLHIQGSDGRYIALELYKRHVRLLWNLGGATAIITHPLEVQTRDPKYDDAWYHVEANRTLNTGALLVRRMNNYGALVPGQPVSGNTDAGYTRFFQTPNERIHLGGYPRDMSQKEIQQSAGLNVVVHNVEVDNRPLGIWNFITSEGRCGGAIIGAQESTSTSIARHFNGLGYAKVKKSHLRSYRMNLFSLQLTFKTLDENALLFLAVDDKNNRSVSVTLSRGRILFRIDYGDESKLEINTTNKYNTGKWVKIEAAREFVPKRGTENGILRVNNERAITGSPTVPIKSHMLPDLSKPVYYLGGVPPGFKSGISKAPGADNPFLGCMKDVQVNRETYDPLESSTHFGVEPSCKEIITKAGFTGQGYIELPSQSLRKRSNTGFVFRTLQSDCLLLLSAYPPEVAEDYDDKDIKGNYSISLIDCHLQVWINSGRSLLKLSSNNTLNDGEFHVVNLIKTGRKFELMIDDALQDTKTLTGTPTLVSMPRDAGGLYIGGAPSYEEFMQLAPTFNKLEGAIRDVVFNNHTVNLNQALAFSNVQIGRNGPPMGTVNGLIDVLLKTEPMIGKSFTASPEGCLRVGSYSYEPSAFKFGDLSHSHAQLQVPQRNFWQRNFHISFGFRSFYPNGLIFLSPGTKEKHKHYVALLLKDGQLLLIVRGRRREELKLTAKLDDGEWHHVTVLCQERKITMSVEIGQTDQKTSAQMKVPRKIAATNVLYVGGLPDKQPKMPAELLQRLEAFKGCLRHMTINNSTQDLARPGKHQHVGQCFPKVEKGSYFPGDAYAIYKRNFHVGKYLEFELDFRTSELFGVLLSISEPSGFPALSLELNNGNIIFSTDLGDGMPFRVQSQLPSKYALCDNKWHNISALYDYEHITLRIDQMARANARSAQQHSNSRVQTKSALYIGGIPEIAPSGTLLTRENFKGCIRNVSIRQERRDWIEMDELHNVLLSECLVTGGEN